MPVSTLVATPGSASANTYVLLTEADQYQLDRPPVGTVWTSATDDQKNAAILWATILMDRLWEWNGFPTNSTQALLWPRQGMLKLNGWEFVSDNVIPNELKQATAEYARQLLVSDRTGDSDIETLGITSVRAGSVSVTFKDSVIAKTVPDAVFNLIPNSWGYPKGRSTSVRNLIRA